MLGRGPAEFAGDDDALVATVEGTDQTRPLGRSPDSVTSWSIFDLESMDVLLCRGRQAGEQ